MIQLLYVDKILQLDQQQPVEPEKPKKCDLLELAMNQDVQIVCNGVKSQVMKDIDIGSNPVTMPVAFVPRAVRSPVNFK